MKNKKLAIQHLKDHHITYPATSDDLITACNNMEEFSEEDRKWFQDNLPAGTYDSPEDVMKALGWEEEEMAGMPA